MIKKMVLLITSALMVMASEFTLDTGESEVFYEAKKDQFFSTYVIMGMNKGLSGILEETANGYEGKLSIDALSFDSDDSRRDENVEEYLHADVHAVMDYDYVIVDNRVEGDMKINGVTKKIAFPVTLSDDAGRLFVEGNITIKYSDFDIETPSNILLSAHDELVIGARLYFDH